MDKSLNILIAIFAAIVIIFMAAFMFNNGQQSHFTLEYLLQLLQDFEPAVNITVITDNTITNSWGVFDFFRTTLNLFIGIFNLGVFFVGNAINAVQFLLYFVSNFFFTSVPSQTLIV